MTMHALSAPSLVDRIKTTLVGLRMPRALEIVDVIVRQLERGEATAREPRLRTALNAPPRRTPMP